MATSKNCFASDLWNFLSRDVPRRVFTIYLTYHSGLCDPKRNRKIPRKNANVAIKRVKSNAPALALSSDSNIDEVNHAKVLLLHDNISEDVEFLEVAL